jgi:peptide-methionine (R)-S-oxide reductase
MTMEHKEKSKQKLSALQHQVMKEKGTEPAFTGKYLYSKEKGVYTCAACGFELFSSNSKFDSGSGWPSFDEPITEKNVEIKEDRSVGMKRLEVVCPRCGNHLGHVFDDGPTSTGNRYCINSCALDFVDG